LLGINWGGIPGAQNPNAFIEFVGMLALVVVWLLALFKWKKWL